MYVVLLKDYVSRKHIAQAGAICKVVSSMPTINDNCYVLNHEGFEFDFLMNECMQLENSYAGSLHLLQGFEKEAVEAIEKAHKCFLFYRNDKLAFIFPTSYDTTEDELSLYVDAYLDSLREVDDSGMRIKDCIYFDYLSNELFTGEIVKLNITSISKSHIGVTSENGNIEWSSIAAAWNCNKF